MATLKLQAQQVEEEVEVTPDFCFQRAAMFLNNVSYGGGAGHEYAKEWRELGLAIHDVGGQDAEWVRAKADAADIDAGIRTRNEVRAARGLPLVDAPEFNRLEGDDGPDPVGAKVDTFNLDN